MSYKLIKKLLKINQGQTLVEIIIALLIITLIGTVFVGVLIQSLHNATFARQKNDAATLARKRLEEVRKVRDVWGFNYIQNEKETIGPSTTYHKVKTSGNPKDWWKFDCSSSLVLSCQYQETVNGVSYTSYIQLICQVSDLSGCDLTNTYFDVQIEVQWNFRGQKKIILNDRLAKF